jgi:hypothetical protein
LISLAICGAFSPRVFRAGTLAPPIDQHATVDVRIADRGEPQAAVTNTKSDRLPLGAPSSALPPLPASELAVLKPAEAIDYAQAEAERLRSARAEAPDLCQRHGVHGRYFNIGRRQSWKCER